MGFFSHFSSPLKPWTSLHQGSIAISRMAPSGMVLAHSCRGSKPSGDKSWIWKCRAATWPGSFGAPNEITWLAFDQPKWCFQMVYWGREPSGVLKNGWEIHQGNGYLSGCQWENIIYTRCFPLPCYIAREYRWRTKNCQTSCMFSWNTMVFFRDLGIVICTYELW